MTSYKRGNHFYGAVFALFGLLLFSLLLSLAYGAFNIPLYDVYAALLARDEVSENHRLIVESIRLPRALLAMCIGALLGITGVVTQGLFRNPLADPSLIGVTAGSAVGASTTLFFLAGSSISLAASVGAFSIVAIGAFCGAIVTVWLVYRLATNRQGTSVSTMLLVGIAITALAASVTGFLDYAANDEGLRRMSLWRMGSLNGATWLQVIASSLMLMLLLLAFSRIGVSLNAMLLGESEARHLGIDTQALKRQVMVWVALGVGLSVALAGMISFVGLIIPHLMRLLLGPDHRFLLPASALAGACLLVLADTASRLVLAPAEVPIGLLTALLGAPFFLVLLMTRRSYDF